jgi:acetyl esterase/lipase
MKKITTYVLIVLLAICAGLFARDYFVEPLYPNGPPNKMGNEDADNPTLTIYLADKDIATGAAVAIFPGGGYTHVAMDHEGHQVAQWLNTFGVSAIIVKYRHGPRYLHPTPLNDAKRAIRTVRFRAPEWNIDPHRIGVLGFSAGGHLASTAGTHFDYGDSLSTDPVEAISSRPDFMILIYPVISMNSEFTHQGSKKNLLGENSDPQLVESLSTDLAVTPETPPTFMVHSFHDQAVPAENSVRFYLAMRKAGVPVELHLFEKGGHGYGLGSGDNAPSDWPELCRKWLEFRGILKKE